MKLNKRYKRSIKSNLSFYISSTVLTITSLLLFFVMNVAGNAILDFYNDFSKENNVEQANFTTYIPIPEREISRLESKYKIELEAQHYVNIETDGIKARVFKKTEKIDLYAVTVGRDVEKNDEIVISEGYAVNNGVAVGDKIKVGRKEYTITGFFQRPDYLFMLENDSDSYKNVNTFFLAYMTNAEFDSIGNANSMYLVRYNGVDDTQIRKEINKNYYMRSYLADSENTRIKMVVWQAKMFISLSYIILCVMPLIAVALISIIISRKVKSEQKMIGTLSAMGYTKGKLKRHYMGFAVIPGLVGGVIMVVLTLVGAQPLGEMGLADYEPMRIVCRLDPVAAVLAVVVPTVMYVIAARLSVRKLLKKDTVLLLSGNADGGKNKLKNIMVGKKISFRIKYAMRSLIGNPARTFVVFLGIFLGSFIILLGLGLIDAMYNTMTKGLDDLGSYNYQYVLNELTNENYNGEPLLVAQMEGSDKKALALIGAEKDCKLLNITDINGNRADLEKGYYITSLVAMVSDIKEGDEITFYNPLDLEEHTVKVAGIISNDMQKAIMTNMDNAARLLGVEKGICNAVMSEDELNIPKSKIVQTVKRADGGESIQNMIDEMGAMLYLVIILGAIICIASIYVAVNMLVTENRANISMLKVLGYTDSRINGIVLRVNHILLPLGILAGIPAAYACCSAMYNLMAELMGVLIKSEMNIKSIIITVLFTSACYFGSLLLVRRKVKKVDMVESLKDNRE